MGVGDDGGGAEGQDGITERLGQHHARLDVDVGIHVPRRDDEPGAIHRLRVREGDALPHRDDDAVSNGDVRAP